MENPPKKRGRKPKNFNNKEIIIKNVITPIITHLPISENSQDSDVCLLDTDKDKRINELEIQVKNLKTKIKKKQQDKFSVYEVNYNNDSVCWWCKHSFDNHKIELPTKYYNDTFYSYGIFCSYECCEAYNIDLNDDNVSNRSSLLKYHYFKTNGVFKNIERAKDWKILKPFGGNVDILEFREYFNNISDDYHYLKPPMISRYAHIEKINLLKNNNNGKDFVIKRSTPLKNNKSSLGKFIKFEKTDS